MRKFRWFAITLLATVTLILTYHVYGSLFASVRAENQRQGFAQHNFGASMLESVTESYGKKPYRYIPLRHENWLPISPPLLVDFLGEYSAVYGKPVRWEIMTRQGEIMGIMVEHHEEDWKPMSSETPADSKSAEK